MFLRSRRSTGPNCRALNVKHDLELPESLKRAKKILEESWLSPAARERSNLFGSLNTENETRESKYSV